MTARHNISIIQRPKGTITSEDCSGKPKVYVSDVHSAGLVYTGYSKSGIVKSDGSKPTAYRNYWVSRAQVGSFGWKFVSDICNRFHPTLPARAIIATATGMPYYPNVFYFGLYGSISNLAYDPSDRLAPNERFYKIRSLCENGALLKLKGQLMAAPVSVIEGKQTFKLAMDLTKDLAATVLHIARGISNPRSLIDQFNKVLKRYGFLEKPPIPKRKKALKKFYNAMYEAFRRKRIKYPDPSIASDASSRWLQYRYGIIPLLGDVEALHDIFYVDALEPIGTSLMSTRYRIKTDARVGGTPDLRGSMSVSGTSKIVAEVKLYYKTSSINELKIKRLGLSLRDMPSTIWELIPFSFVIDWFVNFGDYFSALSASYGLSFAYGYFAVKEEIEDETVFADSVNGQVAPMATESGDHNKAKRKYGVFNRTVYSSFPTPNLPSFKFPFDSFMDKRLADTVSLLTQMRRKGTVV